MASVSGYRQGGETGTGGDMREWDFFFSTEEELVEILGTLYDQPTLITEAGKQNYEKRKLFSWEEVTRQYVYVIENM